MFPLSLMLYLAYELVRWYLNTGYHNGTKSMTGAPWYYYDTNNK